MNWTGGGLAQSRYKHQSVSNKQKQHFAKKRNEVLHGDSQKEAIITLEIGTERIAVAFGPRSPSKISNFGHPQSLPSSDKSSRQPRGHKRKHASVKPTSHYGTSKKLKQDAHESIVIGSSPPKKPIVISSSSSSPTKSSSLSSYHPPSDDTEDARQRLLATSDWAGIDHPIVSRPRKMTFIDPEDRALIGRRRKPSKRHPPAAKLIRSSKARHANMQGPRVLADPFDQAYSQGEVSVRIGSAVDRAEDSFRGIRMINKRRPTEIPRMSTNYREVPYAWQPSSPVAPAMDHGSAYKGVQRHDASHFRQQIASPSGISAVRGVSPLLAEIASGFSSSVSPEKIFEDIDGSKFGTEDDFCDLFEYQEHRPPNEGVATPLSKGQTQPVFNGEYNNGKSSVITESPDRSVSEINESSMQPTTPKFELPQKESPASDSSVFENPSPDAPNNHSTNVQDQIHKEYEQKRRLWDDLAQNIDRKLGTLIKPSSTQYDSTSGKERDKQIFAAEKVARTGEDDAATAKSTFKDPTDTEYDKMWRKMMLGSQEDESEEKSEQHSSQNPQEPSQPSLLAEVDTSPIKQNPHLHAEVLSTPAGSSGPTSGDGTVYAKVESESTEDTPKSRYSAGDSNSFHSHAYPVSTVSAHESSSSYPYTAMVASSNQQPTIDSTRATKAPSTSLSPGTVSTNFFDELASSPYKYTAFAKANIKTDQGQRNNYGLRQPIPQRGGAESQRRFPSNTLLPAKQEEILPTAPPPAPKTTSKRSTRNAGPQAHQPSEPKMSGQRIPAKRASTTASQSVVKPELRSHDHKPKRRATADNTPKQEMKAEKEVPKMERRRSHISPGTTPKQGMQFEEEDVKVKSKRRSKTGLIRRNTRLGDRARKTHGTRSDLPINVR